MQSLKELIVVSPRLPLPLGGLIHRMVPYVLNKATAICHRSEVAHSQMLLDTFERQVKNLDQSFQAKNDPSIPPNLHFVYGLKKREFFPYYAKIAVLSALHHNPGWRAYLHYREEPYGPHWESLKPRMILNIVPDFTYYGTAPIKHYAHKADIIRLLVLRNMGGAYLDIDTVTQRSFEPLQDQTFVMGVQRGLPGQPGGLCNAIMFGAPHAPFLEMWLKQYSNFRSRGTDWLWDFMSVKTPARLANRHPDLITVLKPEALFEPLWTNVDAVLFDETGPAMPPQNFAFHLWNNMIGGKLEGLNVNWLLKSNSLYAQIALPVARAAGDI